jgi:hypothetical protein
VIGGLAFGVLVTILIVLLILRRRRAQARAWENYEDATSGSSNANYPNCMSSPKVLYYYSHPFALMADPNTLGSSQTQERLSPLRPQHANGAISPFTLSDSQRGLYGADLKHAPPDHERTNSATGGNTTYSQTTGTAGNNSTGGAEEPLAAPPSYDAISNRVS